MHCSPPFHHPRKGHFSNGRTAPQMENQMLKQDSSDTEKGKKKRKRGKKSGAMKLQCTRAQIGDSTSEE
eukprot:5252069-Ditylum_brightwellii.AAC.1